VEKDNEPVGTNYTHVDSWASSLLPNISTHQGTNKGVFKPSWNVFMKNYPKENPWPILMFFMSNQFVT
jgi:hypothetical protein